MKKIDFLICFCLFLTASFPVDAYELATRADISRFDLQSTDIDQLELDKMIKRLGLNRRKEDTVDECPQFQEDQPPCIHIEL